MEKIGNMQITDNKENKFFCFPMISMTCTGHQDIEPGLPREQGGLSFSLERE